MSELITKIYEEYRNCPHDVSTIPLRQCYRKRWFYVYTSENKIMISRARYHNESSQLKYDRVLDVANADKMFELYLRRKKDEMVSKEAVSTTVNQVYWYGIFYDLKF